MSFMTTETQQVYSIEIIWEGMAASESPAFRTLYSRFPPPSLVVPTSVCFFCCEKLCNVAKFISCLSWLQPPWVSCLPPSLLLPPTDFPSPYSYREGVPPSPRDCALYMYDNLFKNTLYYCILKLLKSLINKVIN